MSLAVSVPGAPANAGPNADGTLLLHANENLIYTDSNSGYCGQGQLANCASAIATTESGTTPVVFFAVAAFPEGSSPRLRGITFGIDYSAASIVLVDWGTCGDFELADDEWPSPGEGTAVTWSETQSDLLIDVYWFAGYSDSEAATLALVAHPTQGGYFGDDAIPAALDPIDQYGVLGFGLPGESACPSGEDGPIGGDDPDGGDDPGPDGPDDGPDGPVGDDSPESGSFAASVTITPADVELLFETTSAASVEPGGALYFSESLRSTIATTGALSVRKLVPWRTAADTLVYDRWDNLVRRPDLSCYYTLEYASADSATAALNALARSPYVSSAYQEHLFQTMTTPNDSLFNHTQCNPFDPTWYLHDSGPSIEPPDLHWPYYPNQAPPGGGRVAIMHCDVGIIDEHEDLVLFPIPSIHRDAVSLNWDNGAGYGHCGEHGTKMAGLAAARTNNGRGIAGVCNECPVLDIELCTSAARCAQDACTAITSDRAVTAICYAIEAFGPSGPGGPGVLLWESGVPGPGITFAPAWIAAMAEAYKMGLVVVFPAGNERGWVDPVANKTIPFLVGVGGFTQNGLPWGADPAFVDSTQSRGSPIGGGVVDIAGPARASTWTTDRIDSTSYDCTQLLTSGAAALVAGASALQQTWDLNEPGRFYMDQWGTDDLTGLLINATNPFPEETDIDFYLAECEPTGLCDDAPAVVGLEEFGHGMLSLTALYENNGISPSHYFHHVVRWNDPGTEFDPEGAAYQSQEADSNFYQRYRFSQTVVLDPRRDLSRPYVAWPNHIETDVEGGVATTTPLVVGSMHPDFSASVPAYLNLIRDHHLTACELSIPDQWGRATLSGYTVEVIDSLGQSEWLVEPSDLVMSLTSFTPVHVLGPTEVADVRAPRIDFRIRSNPTQGIFVFDFAQNPSAGSSLQIHDSAGRLVWESKLGSPENLTVRWTGVDRNGRNAPSGVYWAKLTGSQAEAAKLVIVR